MSREAGKRCIEEARAYHFKTFADDGLSDIYFKPSFSYHMRRYLSTLVIDTPIENIISPGRLRRNHHARLHWFFIHVGDISWRYAYRSSRLMMGFTTLQLLFIDTGKMTLIGVFGELRRRPIDVTENIRLMLYRCVASTLARHAYVFERPVSVSVQAITCAKH